MLLDPFTEIYECIHTARDTAIQMCIHKCICMLHKNTCTFTYILDMISSSGTSNSNLPPQDLVYPPPAPFSQGESWILTTPSCLLIYSAPSLLPYLVFFLSISLSSSLHSLLFSLPTSLSHSLPPSNPPILFFLLFRLIIVLIRNTVGFIGFSLFAVLGHFSPFAFLLI